MEKPVDSVHNFLYKSEKCQQAGLEAECESNFFPAGDLDWTITGVADFCHFSEECSRFDSQGCRIFLWTNQSVLTSRGGMVEYL